MDQLTSSQISEWEVYDKLDPIGSWRDDYQTAALLALITNLANSIYGKKGEIKTVTALDFMPDWDISNKKKKQSGMSQEELSMNILSAFKSIKKREESKEKLLKKINKPPVIPKR